MNLWSLCWETFTSTPLSERLALAELNHSIIKYCDYMEYRWLSGVEAR